MALKINGIHVSGLGVNGKDGVGVPSGGTSGQILMKNSGADYDTVWADKPIYTGGSPESVDLSNYYTKTEVNNILSNKLDISELQIAVNDALAQAKESGEFDGKDGSDYVLTETDKREIAEHAAQFVETDSPLGSNGLNSTEKTLLLALFQNAVFTSDVSLILAQLEMLWSNNGDNGDNGDSGEGDGNIDTPTFYIVTNKLTNVTNSNATASIMSGNSYTATLTVADGCSMDKVTITMGGTDITSWTYSDGVVNIESVTGNVVITAIAKSPTNITQNGNTLTIMDASSVTQNGSTLIIS